MRVSLVSPAIPGRRTGNTTTAQRWAQLLRDLGHRVQVRHAYQGEDADVLIALHARHSAGSVEGFAEAFPERPIVLALTGTDLYHDIHHDPAAGISLQRASAFVLLQPLGVDQLPEHLRKKAWVIHQSAVPPPDVPPARRSCFEVCVAANLRPVKDPLRTAEAVRLLPATSRIMVTHIGGALDEELEARARAETASNPRYRWRGGQYPRRALRLIGRARLVVLSSLSEGGANVLSEAISMGVPIVSSRIAGSLGILGADHPAYFEPGDTEALAALLTRAEQDPAYFLDLRDRSMRLRPLVDPARERESWKRVLAAVTVAPPPAPPAAP